MTLRRAVAVALAAALALAGCESGTTRDAGAFELERLTVFFSAGSDVVDEIAETTLRELAERLRAHPVNDVAVEGYAEADGPPAEGLALSRRRAVAVARRLTAHGVPPESLRVAGMGMVEIVAMPLEGRRVDVTVQRRAGA